MDHENVIAIRILAALEKHVALSEDRLYLEAWRVFGPPTDHAHVAFASTPWPERLRRLFPEAFTPPAQSTADKART